MTEIQSTQCLRCGSSRFQSGTLFGGNYWYKLGFQSDEQSKRFWPKSSKVRGRACLDCGHVELVLADQEK